MSCTEQKTRRLVSMSGLQLLPLWYLGLQLCAKDGSAFFLAKQNLSRALSSEPGVVCAI